MSRKSDVLAALETLASDSACDVEPIPPSIIATPTPEGDNCRDGVRIAYLLEILICEFIDYENEECCADAASKFLTDYAACPD